MTEKNSSTQNRIVMLLLAAVLIFGLVTALIEPAGEFPPWGYAVFNMGLDAIMTAVLAVLVLIESAKPQDGLKVPMIIAGVLGAIAGVVQVLIRFTSDHAWWTGHYLPPVFN